MLDLLIIAMQLTILSALFVRWRFLDKRYAELAKEKDAILKKLEEGEAEPIDLGQKLGISWKDRHPSADMDPPPGPYDGNGGPAYEPKSAVYLRLKRGGLNLLQAALEAIRGSWADSGFGDFSCPDGPYTLYKAGMEWVKGPDSPIREIHIPVYHRALNVMHIEEGPDGKPTEAGYQAWVKRALCEIYPKWALPESFEPPVLVEKGEMKKSSFDRVGSITFRPPPPAAPEDGPRRETEISGCSFSGPADSDRLYEIARKTHPNRIGVGVARVGGQSELEVWIILPKSLSLEEAEKASSDFRREAGREIHSKYALIQKYEGGSVTPWSDPTHRKSLGQRTPPDAPAGEKPSCG